MLDDREYDVFSHRYMLDGRPFKTLKVLADELGITAQRVQAIQAKAEVPSPPRKYADSSGRSR